MPTVSHLALSRMLRTLPAHSGASHAQARHRGEALAIIAREPLTAPRFDYRIHRAKVTDNGWLSAGETTLYAPRFLVEPGELVAVAATVCTLGTALQERISELFATRRRSLALALDAVSNELLFRLADRATAAVRRAARSMDLEAGLEISPGDEGLPLDQQAAVLTLTGSSEHGLTVSDTGMLAPVKSLSVLVALGRNLRQRSAATRCDACPSRVRCARK
ncbi:MAG: hypothetical protein A3H32_20255 [Betaproteobacteria bacterium RIFCSPLOWO2_02_FULL_63_19]|nr:MAG: hypothetical protein A3H32_20255 [Betaproteobacteria bacterium RIFCSPLOWO2_02_FULL_63_19]